jgi:multidrug efflux pump subunit AcrA (membrane-fusion protein)
MSVEANVVTRQKENVLLVPADALRGSRVFVIDGDRVRVKQVEVGIRGPRNVEIVSGLAEGERVAAPVSENLTDGQYVRVIDRTPEAP